MRISSWRESRGRTCNGGDRSMPVARLDGLLSESAGRFADRIAVEEAGNGRLTYRELHEAAVQLRDQLVAAGVGPGDRVGLYLEKSLASVAAIFGLLNAGAAYVPVDPHAPPERDRESGGSG